ncbi:hypothetical protein V6N12_030511 [Hibiscus sabdariffa]|uniref:Uncharacterized protein n=1 Tax=Hibiscus sabdariffa TaxID=183260 RepID=A0ABR2BBB5_9ROSI
MMFSLKGSWVSASGLLHLWRLIMVGYLGPHLKSEKDGPAAPRKRIEEASDSFMHAPLGSGDIAQLVELRSCNWVVAITGWELRDHPKDAFGIQGSRTDHRTLFNKWNALAVRSQRPTIDNNSPPNTAYNFHRTVLSKEQLFSKSQKVLSWNPILTKDSCGSGGSSYRRTRNGELSPSDSLVLRMLVLRMRFYGRSATPGYRRRPWGDLVVPTGWRRWGWSMDFPSFCRISLKGLKGDSASSCSQGPT